MAQKKYPDKKVKTNTVLKGTLSPEEFYKKLSSEDRKAIANLERIDNINFIPTGSWVLNYLIGDGTMSGKPGGFPRGHVVEMFGDESCGKSTISLSACKQVQDMGGIPVYVDFERTFHKLYAERLGIDTSPSKFILIQPDHFQHGSRLIQDSLSMKPMLIVIDSVAAMIPKQFLEGSVDEAGRIGLQAQLMSSILSYFTKLIPESNTCLLFTNQLRSMIKISIYDRGPTEETSGGRALKFYSSVRIKLMKGNVEYIQQQNRITGETGKEPINVQVKATIVKNKIDRPLLTGPLYLKFGEGIDNITSIILLAENLNVIQKSGPIYKFKCGDKVITGIGKDKFRKILEDNPDVLQKLSESLVFQEDEESKKQYQEDGNIEPPSGGVEELLEVVSENFTKNEADKK